MALTGHRDTFTKPRGLHLMSNNSNTPPDSKLLLRLLGGGYLLYLAWDLREAIREEGPLFLAAVIVFAAVGLFIIVKTLRELANHGYFKSAAKKSTEDSEETSEDPEGSEETTEESNDDCEDRTDE